jgi:hypothetical protein
MFMYPRWNVSHLAKSAGDGPQAREITGRLAALGKAGY